MHYQFNWSVLWSGQSASWLLEGVLTTLELSVLAWLVAVFLGILSGALRTVTFAPLRAAAAFRLDPPAAPLPPDRPADDERIAQPPEELVGGADDQRRRAHVPDAPDRDVHGTGDRSADGGHADLPRDVSRHRDRDEP